MKATYTVFLIAALASPAVWSAGNIADLAGFLPGAVMPASAPLFKRFVPSPPAFVFFRGPTLLPELAKTFPDYQVYVLRDGRIAGMRWARAYAKASDCESTVASLRHLMQTYLPAKFAGEDNWRYQMQSVDGAVAAGVDCKKDDLYPTAQIELVHVKTDHDLSQSMRSGAN